MAFGNRQAVALVFFLRGSDFAKFFYKKTLAKSLPLKKYSKTYLLPSVKVKNLSLTVMVCNLDALRLSYCIEVTNLDDPIRSTALI